MAWLATTGRQRLLLAFFLFLTTFFALLNIRVPAGGIVSDALLDRQNPYVLAQQAVAKEVGLQTGDTLGFVLRLEHGLTLDAISQIRRMTEEIKQRFPEAVVLSLSDNALYYQSSADEVISEPYLRAGMRATDLVDLKQRIAANPLVYGPLIGQQFEYAQIMLFLPDNYSEQDLVQRVGEYLEKRNISQLEWMLLKGDIQPVDEYANVSLSGWSVARGLMHYALISDVLFYSTIGLTLATLAAFLALGSWRQALFSSLTIFVSFIWIRGSIALFSVLGVEFYGAPLQERVYFLLVLSSMIVAGISLNVRAFEAFNARWRSTPQVPGISLWRELDSLSPRFNLVIGIAALNFATLGQIGIRGIMEVGVLSALGLIYQRLLVVTLLPALQLQFGGTPHVMQNVARKRLLEHAMASVQRWLHLLPQKSVHFWLRYSSAQSSRLVVAILSAALAAALVVVGHDLNTQERLIEVKERPIDYLPGTIIDRGREVLNAPDAYGFAQLAFFVRPRTIVADGEFDAVDDPAFLARAYSFQQRLQNRGDGRAVISILDQVAQMQLSPDEQTTMPRSAQQAHDDLQLIKWDLSDERLSDFWWTKQGVVLMASHPADDSASLRQYADDIRALAASEFPDLLVLPYGRLQSYHQADLYISERKPANMLMNLPLVMLCASLWFLYCNHKTPMKGSRLSPVTTAMAVCTPFIFSYALIIVAMALFHIPLDQTTACATALGINAAIDFDLYLVEDYRYAMAEGKTPDQALQYSIGERGHLTLLDAMLNAICFSPLLVSSFIPMQRLGCLMLVLLAACAFGALFLLSGLLRSCVCSPSLPSLQEEN
ncbi:hypothetical protein [Vibrio sp. CAU 1672]|uniref:hypothetical protein n=1 Tax=Vibrio sp. CAU 1672 TaxID=3032594 RepID=UPI0023DB06F8|nr:hypothetical protein [Vibrio sp. CAU 1672]MDF2152809.1 hypothetical protein [Vibrio sp. CAU 1672]